jgi:hypothetical protein
MIDRLGRELQIPAVRSKARRNNWRSAELTGQNLDRNEMGPCAIALLISTIESSDRVPRPADDFLAAALIAQESVTCAGRRWPA